MLQAQHGLMELEDLISRCLGGDDDAWCAIFDRYHPHLVPYVRYLLQGAGGLEQAEEIAAAVWSSLLTDDYQRLRRYDPKAGNFLRYLGLLARGEIWRWRRSVRSRQARENRAARRESTTEQCERGIVIQEFLETLTPREREFCLAYLLNEVDPGLRCEFTSANGWQLRCRVLKKFRMYWSRNS